MSDWINPVVLLIDIFTVHTRYTLGVYKNDSSQSWYTLAGEQKSGEHSFLSGCAPSLSLYVHCFARSARTFFAVSLCLFGLWMFDDAIRWNRYDSDNLFAKHCNPSLIVSRARCLLRVQTLAHWGERERMGNGVRVVHWRHAVSVMYRAEKARYSQFIFRFSHATINRSHSRLRNIQWNECVSHVAHNPRMHS